MPAVKSLLNGTLIKVDFWRMLAFWFPSVPHLTVLLMKPLGWLIGEIFRKNPNSRNVLSPVQILRAALTNEWIGLRFIFIGTNLWKCIHWSIQVISLHTDNWTEPFLRLSGGARRKAVLSLASVSYGNRKFSDIHRDARPYVLPVVCHSMESWQSKNASGSSPPMGYIVTM